MILTRFFENFFRGAGQESPASVIERFNAAVAANDTGAANGIIDAALARNPNHKDFLYCKGVAELRRANYAAALAGFNKVILVDPNHEDCLFHIALCQKLLGNTQAAIDGCYALLDRNLGHGEAHNLLSAIELPGPQYSAILAELHRTLNPATYLEIGVESGHSIALTLPDTMSIGVDPEPKISVDLHSGIRIFPMTSDDFFAKHDVSAEFGGRTIDMAFIDGMHHFDFSLRDFAAVEHYCRTDSVVLVHDCFPIDRMTASRDRQTWFWSGDVWKTVIALKKYRPDLHVRTIAAPPTGLGLITNLNPASRVLTERMDEIVADMNDIDYSILDNNKRETLNWFPNDWPSIQSVVGHTPFRRNGFNQA